MSRLLLIQFRDDLTIEEIDKKLQEEFYYPKIITELKDLTED